MLRFTHLKQTVNTFAIFLFIVLSNGAAALANNTSGTADELNIGTHISNFQNVITGPFVKLAAAVLVLVAVFMMSKGEEMQQGLRTIGGVVMGFALLLALPSILNLVGVGVTGSIVPFFHQ